MKKSLLITAIFPLFFACKQQPEEKSALETETSIEVSSDSLDIDAMAATLKEEGHQVFVHEFDGEKYLMQEYFMVFLKQGGNRGQDSLEMARLQEQHLAHLTRMAEEGYSSLTGPFGGHGEIRGIVVYNTATLEEADSLARLDPMVQAGRLEVEVHSWWTEKGGQLD